jgi:hypothetical protein
MNAIDIAQNGAGFTLPEMSMTDKMMAGVKGLGSEAGRDLFMQNIGGAKGLFKSGYAAALPVMMAGSGETASPPAGSGKNPYEYDFTPGYTGPVRTPGGGTRFFDPRYVLRRAEGGETYADGGNTGMTGESDDYYRYLMGLAPMPTAYAAPVATPVNLGPLPEVVPQINSRPVRPGAELPSLGGEQPTPPNPDFMFMENGQLNPLAAALASIGNTLGINTPQQGAIGGLPGLLMGNPLGILAGAAVGNAVQGQNMLALNNSLNQALGGQGSGIPQPGQPGFVAALPGAILSQSSLASSLINDEVNASLGMAGAGQPGVDIGAIGSSIGDAVAGISDADVSAAADAAGAAAPTSAGDYARGGLSSIAFANGGYNLGDYSDGGRLLRGPGDGVSDSIPASIADKRPARLADGEFVVPARIVSELGNGSTEAGARKLYAMMDRVQKTRGKTTGKGRVAVNSRSDRYLPA